MTDDEEPSMRQQLVAARENIVEQLDRLHFGATKSSARRVAPLDFQLLITELEGQLREIDMLLDTSEDGNA